MYLFWKQSTVIKFTGNSHVKIKISIHVADLLEWVANLLESYLQAGGDVDGKLDETAANLILDMKPSKVVSNELTVSSG